MYFKQNTLFAESRAQKIAAYFSFLIDSRYFSIPNPIERNKRKLFVVDEVEYFEIVWKSRRKI